MLKTKESCKMRCNYKNWLKSVSALALVLFLVTAAGSAAQRQAKRGRDWGNPNWGGSAVLRQTALQAGYDEGIKAGRNDRSRGERFNFEDESAYKDATKGYNTQLGDKTIYRRYFRAGFENAMATVGMATRL
jgi:hypothetical protein